MGRVRGAPSMQFLSAFGPRLLSNDVEVSKAALKALAGMRLDSADTRASITSLLAEYARRHPHAKESLKEVLAVAKLDFDKDISPLNGKKPVSVALPDKASCSEGFARIAE